MDVDINWLGIVLATLAAMIVGGIWYAPPVFGDKWAKIVAIDEAKAKKAMPVSMLVMLGGAFIKAFMLSHLIGLSDHFYVENSYLHNALGTAFAIWFGFILIHVFTRNLFEQKRFKLTLIILGNELVTLLAMGLVIGIVGI